MPKMIKLKIKTQTNKKRLTRTRNAKIKETRGTKREVEGHRAKIGKIVRGPKDLRNTAEMKNEGTGAEADIDHAGKGIIKRRRKTEVIK